MGLRGPKSPPLYAGVGPKSPHPLPTPPLPRKSDRINPVPTSNQIMGQKSNTHKRMMTHQPSTRQGKKSFKRSAECSFSLQGRSMGVLLPALSSLASQQANLTEKTMGLCKQFLYFMSTQEDAVLTYQASDMVHSDVSYLSEHKSRRWARSHMYMVGKDKSPSTTRQTSTSCK